MFEKIWGRFALVVLGLASVGAGPGASLAAPPIEAYGQLPSIQQMDVSPDGEHLAMLIGVGAARRVQIRNTSDLKLVTTTPVDNMKIRSLSWAGPDHLLVLYTQADQILGFEGPKREWEQGIYYDLKRNHYYPLVNSHENSLNSTFGTPTYALNVIFGRPVYRRVAGNDKVYFVGVHFVDRKGLPALYERDFKTQLSRLVDVGGGDTESWLVDSDGVPNVRVDYNQPSGKWSLFIKTRDGWTRALTQTALLDPPSLNGLGRDGQSVLVDLGDKDHRVVTSVSLADGKLTDTTLSPDDIFVHDPKTRALIGTITLGDEHSDYRFFTPHDQALWDAIAKGFAGEKLTLASWSDDRQQVVVKAEGPKYGDAYFLVDQKGGTAKWLADEYDDVGPDDIAPVKFIHYAAADGTSIPAYLTLPLGRPAKGLPLVVLVHGGPQARDRPGFDWLSQAFASRGYAVLQPEFRGSSGFGAAFIEAGYGQWGKKMQTDVSDGVRELVKSGVVDPKRVCIAGWSYGGYAALAGAVFDSAA
jgi:dipeptidyl aminopeptidase/acylaminoacyl peptidase